MASGSRNRTDQNLEHIDIDITRRIAKVSVHLYTSNKYINKLKFLDETDNIIMNLEFDCNYGDEWVTHEIPKGQEIIGLYCNTETGSNINSMNKLGFLLWTPNPWAL